MRIGVDATGVKLLSGINVYTINLVNHILRADSGNEYVIYCMGQVPDGMTVHPSHARFEVIPAGNRKLWQQIGLPRRARRDGLDLLFFPSNSVALRAPCKTVATIHDLHPFVHPEPFRNVHTAKLHKGIIQATLNHYYWKNMLRWAARKDRIITDSRNTADDVMNHFGVSDEKIDVVLLAVDRDRFAAGDEPGGRESFLARHHLPPHYVLCVGTHAFKNLEGSIRAFHEARLESDFPVKLVIAGSKSGVSDSLYGLVRELDIEEHVRFIGFFPDEDLPGLYRQAVCLLFPSFYEGFGFPILEAFSCGTPVLTSNCSCMPEVAGTAALLADPHDPQDIAAKLALLLNSSSLRAEKIREGLEQASQFSWEKVARETIASFRKVMEQPG